MSELSDYRRIVEKPTIEKYEQRIADLTASLNRASDACASVQRERDDLREELERLREAIQRIRAAVDFSTPESRSEIARRIELDLDAGLSLRETSKKQGVGIGVVRGVAAKRKAAKQDSTFLARYEALK